MTDARKTVCVKMPTTTLERVEMTTYTLQDLADTKVISEAMTEVADRYAHRLALELECVLADRPGYYDKAMQVLGEYRSAMNAIHERHSPTFMGEPLIHADHHGPDWTQRDGEYLK